MKDFVILGAGGFAREASLLAEEINSSGPTENKLNLLGYIDEDETKWGLVLRGYPVLGGRAALAALPPSVAVIGVVGDPAVKKRLVEQAEEQGRLFVTLIHPGIALAADIQIGKGVLINKGCLLTTKIKIGDHVSINPGCGIGHDAVVGAYSTLMWHVNLSGAVQVGPGCLIGTGAIVLQGLKVGAGSVVGAGAVVTKDQPENCTAVGVPARVVKMMEG